MNDRLDLDRIVADWLRAGAPPRAPRELLPAALEQVAAVGQERPLGGRRFDEWISASPRLHWAIVGALLAAALLGAIAGGRALLRRETPPLAPTRATNGWIAYSTDGQNPGSTDVTTGSDIYVVREGGQPRLIAGRQGGTTRNACPAFSPDGTRLAFGVASNQGRAVVVLGLDANGVISDTLHITVPGYGPAVCVRWSSDGKRVGYLDRGVVVVRGLDGSTPAIAADDPGVKDLERGRDPSDPLLSPSGDWMARLSFGISDCQIVVARPDGTAAHIVALSICPYAIAAWSPDGRQVLLLEDKGEASTLRAIGIDSPLNVTVVSAVSTNGARSSPGRGDVSWQPVFP
jgi:WD40-like Beta Propeller Repeat